MVSKPLRNSRATVQKRIEAEQSRTAPDSLRLHRYGIVWSLVRTRSRSGSDRVNGSITDDFAKAPEHLELWCVAQKK